MSDQTIADALLLITTNSVNNDSSLLDLSKAIVEQVQLLNEQNRMLSVMVHQCHTQNIKLERRLDALLDAFYTHCESNVNQ